MRLLRLLLNASLRPLADPGNAAGWRAADQRILRRLSRAGSALRVPDAHVLAEPWMLDCLRILAGGIARTPYQAELSLPYPLVVSVSSASTCAIGCSFCYSDSTAGPDGEVRLSPDLCARLARTPVPIVMLTGGEPFHHPQLASLLDPLLAAGKKIFIATNAPSVRVGRELLPYRGQVTLLLSQWGPRARHEQVRGPGNLRRTWAGAERLATLGHRVYLNYVLSPGTVAEDFETVTGILSTCPWLERVYLSRELLVGRVPAAPASTGMDPAALRRRVERLAAQFPGRVVPALPELVPAGRVPAPRLLMRLLGIALPASCGAGRWTLHVDPAGTCYPCFAHEGRRALGSLLTEDLAAIWHRAGAAAQRAGAPGAAPGCWAEHPARPLELAVAPRAVGLPAAGGGTAGPAAAGPAANDPAANDPAANDPAANDPAANDPAANDPAANDPAAAGPAAAGPRPAAAPW
jgi:MoaA/NifB/PqqE/SkfB family radical SAM enzyme